ncbi:hypothetical protein OA90_27095 [Labrenzia sp. OB1]|nr:hypothetical protein OA90_27095 [Labrenzia sp. OB1]
MGCFSAVQADSFHGVFTFVENQAVKIVGEIGQRQFCFSTSLADGADKQAIACLLMRKDMLYRVRPVKAVFMGATRSVTLTF